MSLKAFHVVFIVCSILLAVGFGIWEIVSYSRTASTSQLIMGLVSFAVAAALVVYGIRFVRKLRNVGYL